MMMNTTFRLRLSRSSLLILAMRIHHSKAQGKRSTKSTYQINCLADYTIKGESEFNIYLK
jgi:hypothetical protein